MTETSSGGRRAFRFGIVAPFLPDLPTWRQQVRRIAGHGYATVLMPDFPRSQPSPAPALAVAPRSPMCESAPGSTPRPCARHC